MVSPKWLCFSIGIAAGAASVAAIGQGSRAPQPFYTAPQLKSVDILGVRLGMPLAAAEAVLTRRGMLREAQSRDSFPADGSFGAVRYTTERSTPLVDLIYHRVRGNLVVTGLGLQEDVGVTGEADKDRVIRARYGTPTYVERTRYETRYHYTERGWPRDRRQLAATNSCLSVFMTCVEPGVPRDCPANLIRRGTVMSAGFGGGAIGGSRLYVNLWDWASQADAVYRGRSRLPIRPVCLSPIAD